jgi:ferredoxin
MARIIRDHAGAAWEKRGNSIWTLCARCETAFPVSVLLTRAEAPQACCPACHHRFPLHGQDGKAVPTI